MRRPAANLTETPSRRAVLIGPDAIDYSDGTRTLWRPSGPVTFRASRRLTSNRHGARWIVYATSGRPRLLRADRHPEPGWAPVLAFRAPAGTYAGTPSLLAVERYHAATALYR